MTTAFDLAEIVASVAAEFGDMKAKRDDDGFATYFVGEMPNSLIGQALAKSGAVRPGGWQGNTARPSVALPAIGITLTAAWAAWFDAIAVSEDDGGATFAGALAAAGRMPVEVPEADGIYAGIPDGIYHGDPHSLSSSGARTLLEPGGPAKFRHARRVDKAEYDFGHVAHALILGEGSQIAIIDAKDWRTKAAQVERDAARATGLVPVLRSTYRAGESLALAAKSHALGELLFAEGQPEQSVYWHDDQTGVRLRCRPDWMTAGPLVVDVKTTKSAAPREFSKSVVDYGYHCQEAFYRDGLAAHGIDAQFLFFAIEKGYPYLCSVIELPAEAVAAGRALNRAAIDLYARCRETDIWPGYPPIIHRADLPDWAYRSAESTVTRIESELAA
ncbi:PD-(D/E)XK nuclease-like domain-containing protein [Gordonia sp. ABSL1-1]|uniref:PD-(D/E)XK nuclease-like domain-containing protein n=1 Tax=Gordonia sp. ABSL1-1 TaxID=3053923 RepID=UPI00257487EC|nr:PD-(D/E)XK nuclease-like domain-containing protein [Gordonia sp. ABSL1-1]MDL9938711.1 PD-(D/E)XK nuclease-like domain-containing protein [Gordonia sp. ABSL1-1]